MQTYTPAARTLTTCLAAIISALCSGAAASENTPVAVPTFHCIGEQFPTAAIVSVPKNQNNTLVIDNSGAADGYILYTGKAGATIDVAGKRDHCIEVRASHVIVRGLTLKNARSHVIRYNDIWSDKEHYYNDIIGGGHNFCALGSPSRDSDIYANRLQHCWDDAIEAEGANCSSASTPI